MTLADDMTRVFRTSGNVPDRHFFVSTAGVQLTQVKECLMSGVWLVLLTFEIRTS